MKGMWLAAGIGLKSNTFTVNICNCNSRYNYYLIKESLISPCLTPAVLSFEGSLEWTLEEMQVMALYAHFSGREALLYVFMTLSH